MNTILVLHVYSTTNIVLLVYIAVNVVPDEGGNLFNI